MYVCGKKYDNQNITFPSICLSRIKFLKELFMLEFNNFAPDFLALINNSFYLSISFSDINVLSYRSLFS